MRFTILTPDAQYQDDAAVEQQVAGKGVEFLAYRTRDPAAIPLEHLAAHDALLVWHEMKIDQTLIDKAKKVPRHCANSPDAPRPGTYPVQFDLTAAMRQTGLEVKDVHRMPLWAGQSAAFARRESAGDFVRRTWVQAQEFLP